MWVSVFSRVLEGRGNWMEFYGIGGWDCIYRMSLMRCCMIKTV